MKNALNGNYWKILNEKWNGNMCTDYEEAERILKAMRVELRDALKDTNQLMKKKLDPVFLSDYHCGVSDLFQICGRYLTELRKIQARWEDQDTLKPPEVRG